MNSKYDESDLLDGESDFSYSIENCNHLISNSLRDLSKKYKDLNREKPNFRKLNKKTINESLQSKKSDKN